MRRFLRHCLTDFAGEFDAGRVLASITIIAGVFLSGWSVIVQGHQFDATQYGTGIGGMLTGLAVYIFADAKARPHD